MSTSSTTRRRTSVLRLTVLLCCWLRTSHSVAAANITIEDTHPSIVYSPLASWHPSSNLCSTCLDPGISTSYHEGIHLAPSLDPGDPTSASSSSTPTHGADDPPITVSFNFTGSAIYIFCIQPLGEAAVNGTPTNMNLYFTLDNQPSGNFSSTGTPGSTGFLPSQNVLSLNGLSNEPHQLVVNVGDDSVFLFDRLIYTDDSVRNVPSSTSPPAIKSSATTTQESKKNNVATFGGAIGGSVGVLSLLSLGIAISIIRRRMLAARRDRLDNEAHATGDTPLMSGPVPFFPRYFPDTIIPSDPPTYEAALSSIGHNNTSTLASLPSSEYPSRQRSYADIPPASPPPPLEEIPPPPPFPLAFSAPIPALPLSPTTTVANQTPGSPDIVGNDSSNFTSSSGNLLQSSDRNDIRPRSRMSTSSLESTQNSEINHHQEDAS